MRAAFKAFGLVSNLVLCEQIHLDEEDLERHDVRTTITIYEILYQTQLMGMLNHHQLDGECLVRTLTMGLKNSVKIIFYLFRIFKI